ncbi:hypothetical protein HRbin36_02493 [bacterium HR36]|nr:hypothetical protein HRbin36_02493 [bacterium HR36]
MLYLVDGYNVLYSLGLLRKESGPRAAARARQALLQRIAAALGAEAHKVLVLFDAARAPADLRRQEQFGPLRVRYSPRHQDADSLIIELAQGYLPSQVVIVSADRALRRAARRRKCQCWTPDQFVAWLEQCRRQRLAVPGSDEKERLAAQETQTWLREFAHLDKDPSLGQADPFRELDIGDLLGQADPDAGEPPDKRR